MYFCRGQGYGHAYHSDVVVEALESLDVQCTRVAFGSSRRYYAMHGLTAIDSGIDDTNDHSKESLTRAIEILEQAGNIDLVIADELAYMPRVARLFGLPILYLTCQLGSEVGVPERDSLLISSATRVLIPDWREVHPGQMSNIPGLVFTGPIVRRYGNDRNSAKQILGLDINSRLCVVSPGSFTLGKRDILMSVLDSVFSIVTESGGEIRVLGDDSWRHELSVSYGQEFFADFGARGDIWHAASDQLVTLGTSSTLEAAYNHKFPITILDQARILDRARSDFMTSRAQYLTDRGLGVTVNMFASKMELEEALSAEYSPARVDEPIWGTVDRIREIVREVF